MLETPNCRSDHIYPVWLLPHGDDGKRRPFHVVHCMASPPCSASLRISPGKHSRLPPECVAKFAAQKGWLADRKGYALCPEHKPGGAGRPPSDMPPHQKRAAFLAIRDRNLAEAAERMLRPAKPVGTLAKEVAAIRARAEAVRAHAPDQAPDPTATLLRSRILAFIGDNRARVWRSRREAAIAGGFNIWTFNDFVKAAIAKGLVVRELMKPPAARPFRLRLPDQFDPPAMQPEPEESAMPEVAESIGAPPPIKAEPPPEPTLEANRRIRVFLDANFDDEAGLWIGDLSDAKAAERLRVPRAWVAAIRSALYGEADRSEADEKAGELATELVADAIKLKDDALSIATRAEEFERRARAFLNGRSKQ